MHRFRKKPSPSTSPTNSQPPTSTPPIVDYIKQELATFYPQTKDSRALAAASSAIALSIASPSCDPTGTTPDEPGSSKESGWRTAYGAARMAVEVANASSDMFLPLKAVVGALSVLLKNYDVSPANTLVPSATHRFWQQTAANTDQIGEIGNRVESLCEVLESPVDDEDSEEKARREALRRFVSPLSL